MKFASEDKLKYLVRVGIVHLSKFQFTLTVDRHLCISYCKGSQPSSLIFHQPVDNAPLILAIKQTTNG